MTTLINPGEALKNKIKHAAVEEELRNNLQRSLKDSQAKTPLDYMEVLGLLLSHFIGTAQLFTLENCLADIPNIVMRIATSKPEASKNAGNQEVINDSSLESLCTIYSFLKTLHGLTDCDNHLQQVTDWYRVSRWEQLKTSKRNELLDMYGPVVELK